MAPDLHICADSEKQGVDYAREVFLYQLRDQNREEYLKRIIEIRARNVTKVYTYSTILEIIRNLINLVEAKFSFV